MEPYQETPTEDDAHDAADIMAQTMGFSSFGAAARPSKRRRMDGAVVASPEGPPRVSGANLTSVGIRLPQRVVPGPHTPASAHLNVQEQGGQANGATGVAASAAPVEGTAAGAEASGPASEDVPAASPHGQPGRPYQPWYVDYYDRKSNQNPWKKLEENLGLESRGSWPPP
ncbi:hypothetical protein PspLS_06218 [Pyricularia sp. CBS 133598]|nr:hypothetical protein PspLS_06218 [Pyricularia sp. CBS 133598]